MGNNIAELICGAIFRSPNFESASDCWYDNANGMVGFTFKGKHYSLNIEEVKEWFN